MKRNRRKYWQRHGEEPSAELQRRQHFLFNRFLARFGLGTILMASGIALVIVALIQFLTSTSLALPTLLLAVGVSLILVIGGWGICAYVFEEIAYPLSELMGASERIAQGELTARTDESGQGDFRRLMETFNMMVSELERMDTQRRNLTADIAHELRNPLHVIQGNLEGVMDGIYSATPQHIQSILDEIQLLNRLIEDLRTLSMAESGQIVLEREVLDVSDFITGIYEAFHPKIAGAGIQFQLEVSQDQSTFISVDKARLAQVFNNLILNALHYTPTNGMITLEVSSTVEAVEFKIRDTGTGISEEKLPYIFDRFWRGDVTRTRQEGIGGGLGLAIARQLIECHHGAISVESHLDKGSCFTLNIPRFTKHPQLLQH